MMNAILLSIVALILAGCAKDCSPRIASSFSTRDDPPHASLAPYRDLELEKDLNAP